jgi:glycosyltransferase involved in cell wall biosynthesis
VRIALITRSFLPRIGGAEFVVHHLANQWCHQGHDVCVMNAVVDKTTQPDSLYAVRRYRQLRGSSRLGAHRFPFAWYCATQLKNFLNEYEPDFISAHFAYPVAVWMSMIRPLPKFLITCHGPALNETPRGPRAVYGIDKLLADSMNLSLGVVAISSHARHVMERIGVKPKKILNIPNGVDTQRFRTEVDFNLRDKFGLPQQALVILSVGREAPGGAKAYDQGLRAFAQVATKLPDAYYVILGKGTDKWLLLAQQLNINNKVVFCSGLYGDELAGAYQQADIFFLPSIKELCPLVVLEAMAAGRPQVVTDVSGSQDMIQTGLNGIVAQPGNVKEISEALYRLASDESLRKRFGQANLKKAVEYDWEIISRRYLQLVQ